MIAARGKLKIFFGYSAGAGKTYAMLKAAQEEKSAGVDVVIGYLEPHDRPETLKMAEGLEVLPLKKIQYRGITLNEFDVDAAERRRPKLLLVDELAHTNAPDCKNRKRYLDIEEVLNCGIDVYTTVNVQHIEGLHDLVDSATSVDVNERIPDEIFDYADEVVLVDIEPDALIERMREGKIYPRGQSLFFARTVHATECRPHRKTGESRRATHENTRSDQPVALLAEDHPRGGAHSGSVSLQIFRHVCGNERRAERRSGGKSQKTHESRARYGRRDHRKIQRGRC